MVFNTIGSAGPGSFTISCLYHQSGILSEGDKHDSKPGLASHNFAPKPASWTRPRRIYSIQEIAMYLSGIGCENAWLDCASDRVVGWYGRVLPEGSQIFSKPTETCRWFKVEHLDVGNEELRVLCGGRFDPWSIQKDDS